MGQKYHIAVLFLIPVINSTQRSIEVCFQNATVVLQKERDNTFNNLKKYIPVLKIQYKILALLLPIGVSKYKNKPCDISVYYCVIIMISMLFRHITQL